MYTLVFSFIFILVAVVFYFRILLASTKSQVDRLQTALDESTDRENFFNGSEEKLSVLIVENTQLKAKLKHANISLNNSRKDANNMKKTCNIILSQAGQAYSCLFSKNVTSEVQDLGREKLKVLLNRAKATRVSVVHDDGHLTLKKLWTTQK